jgi:hypothetical protein
MVFFYWSACTKPGKWEVIFMCVRGIYFTSSQESEWSYLCVLGVFIWPLPTIFILYFGTVLTVCYFCIVFWNCSDSVLFLYCILELFWLCYFCIVLWNCSDCAIFVLYFGTVLTVLFLYCILEPFWQCAIFVF